MRRACGSSCWSGQGGSSVELVVPKSDLSQVKRACHCLCPSVGGTKAPTCSKFGGEASPTELERFFTTGSMAGIRPAHADKLKSQLAVLDNARSLGDIPAAWRPRPLVGSSATGKTVDGHHAIWVSGNWRLTFDFDGTDFY